LYFRSGPQLEQVPKWAVALARFPGKFLWDGHTAVTLFFVLSGFVLSLGYCQNRSSTALGCAATRRYPRLMLPVLASVLLAHLLLVAGLMYSQEAVRLMNEAQGLRAGVKGSPGHTNNWLGAYYGFAPDLRAALREGLFSPFRTTVRYNFVLWTMPIELVGSFLVYCFLALFGGLRGRWLLYAVCCAFLLADGHELYLDFLIGVGLCDVWVRSRETLSLSLTAALVLITAAVFLVPWKPLVAGVIVGTTAFSPRLQRSLGAGWLMFLGRVSFGLYLVHMPVLCSLGCALYVAGVSVLHWPHSAAGLVASCATLAGSLLVAWAFFHAIDRPTIALTRWLEECLFRPREDRDDLPEPAVWRRAA
jgi:peptidoglycan/LPS O-acetylase OafA/YrhL